MLHVTHVELAFVQSSIFNEVQPSKFPLFTNVETVRSQFTPGTSIMVAIGGWGDTEGFSKAAATESTRKLFARNVKAMVDSTGADGKSNIQINPMNEAQRKQALILIGNILGMIPLHRAGV